MCYCAWYRRFQFILDFSSGDSIDQTSQPTDPDTCELYLSLMCQFKRDRVLSFVQECDVLRRHKALEVSQRNWMVLSRRGQFTVDFTFQIVRRYRVDDATAHLLEESGDISAAFTVLLNVSRSRMKQLNSTNSTFSKFFVAFH